jgi:hypothetical protein
MSPSELLVGLPHPELPRDHAYSEAAQRFDDLYEEAVDLPGDLKRTYEVGDVDHVLALQRRQRDLPTELAIAEVALLRLRVVHLEREVEAYEDAAAPYAALRDRYQHRLDEANAALSGLRSVLVELETRDERPRRQLAEARARLAQLAVAP